MFTKNTYLIPQVPSSANGVEIFLHHHHPGHYLASANAPPVVHASTMLNRENSGPCLIPKTVKKDRHSKIYTAQGPRDRRVRLSIGIARKFFDLQEMLGFDKPSKTLDWLLTKSKNAIKELVQSKHKGSTSSSECELVSSAGNCETSENCDDSKGKDKGRKSNPVVPNLAKETRAKARARARERTREKMSIKQQLNGARNMSSGFNNSIPVQNRNNKLDFFQLSAGIDNNNNNNNNVSSSFHCPLTNEDLIHESIVIKRKTKSPSFFGFQQNVIVSRDSTSNYNTIPSGNATENWDNICSFTSQSNLYAILDQHKFINSNSNI